jgi:hypothetical protein
MRPSLNSFSPYAEGGVLMNLPKIWVILGALAAALGVGILGLVLVINPARPLLEAASFAPASISPNADGQDDVSLFSYRLSEAADIRLIFEDEAGRRFVFRDGDRRVAGDYSVLFSGVVAGFELEGESLNLAEGATLETRLMPDGVYTWTFRARSDGGEVAEQTGRLEIRGGDAELPLIQAFDLNPPSFSPNQDGIRDRVSVNIYLSKPANLQVYLENAEGARTYLSERAGGRQEGEAGNHEFDYDGGVDQGFRPPPDGDYTLVAVAQDDEGQRMVYQKTLRIENSGLPQVEIIPQATGGTVCFEAGPYQEAYFSDREAPGEAISKPTSVCSELTTLTLALGDLLIFRLSVYNYGLTPVRTAGPFPGTVYQQDQRSSSLGAYEQSGAWRVGIMCDTSESDYPWRWALAPLEALTAVYDPQDDQTYYYLEAGQRAETWGAIRMTELIPARNPQPCWAGLIHEDVGIPARQNNVGRREIELAAP